jgi:NADH dehydrogenase
MALPRVVIIGAGFGGLECARKLARKPADVLIIDRNNYHLFTPLLYQVASSLLNPSDITRPVRAIVRKAHNVRFRHGEVAGVDFERRAVLLADGDCVMYDYLVIAAGTTTNYFGMRDVEDRAFGLKDLPEALELRNHVLRCLESAAISPDEARAWLTFVVVGGGPTGVEYAGALSELVKLVLPDEYPELAGRQVRIVLVEGLPELLPAFSAKLGRAARKALMRKGIEIWTSTRVTGTSEGAVTVSGGKTLEARTLIWAAGVRPAAVAAALDVARSRSGRIEVDEFLRVPGRPAVFAIGDVAAVRQDGSEVPMLSAPAMQEARVAATNILRSAAGKPLQPFGYRDRGSMATIGKNAAVAEIGRLRMTGFAGWVLWLAVHLYYIIGFRNRLAVLAGWAWNYLRSDRPIRIIARAKERDPVGGRRDR